MRIKRIEVIGFKSFCDRSVINITQPITGVVGPNGCGKSNIVDAIRWCMGEQSAKHLRGKAMDDVIFAGSETRGPAAMAEVSLTFEDIGFSHETLQFGMGSDEDKAKEAAADASAQAEAAGEGEGSEDGVEVGDGIEAEAAAEPEATSEAAADAAPEAAAEAAPDATTDAAADAAASAEAGAAPAGSPEAAAGGPPGSGMADVLGDDPSASADVEDFLQDQPAAIDFTKYSEVTITRRLFRDGTSQYLINKTPCRLRDVTDFFLGTGVGTKAYSIIEQGRIGMIVSARPQDRRAIIEEAAGITKFKTKKRAAERKLEQTRQNLLRVSDIVSELDKRMGTLRRQAQKAERYRKYKSEVRDIELWRAAHKFLEMRAEQMVLERTLADSKESLDTARTELDVRDAKLLSERAELAVEERRLSALQETIFELENRIKLSESKVEFQTREAKQIDERVTAARTEIESLEARRVEGTKALEQRRTELEALEEQVEIEQEGVDGREMAVTEARQMLANAQSRLTSARAQLEAARADLVRAESKQDALVRRREESSRRLERIMEDTHTANERVAVLSKEAKALDSKLAELRQTRLDLGSQVENLQARKELLEETVHRGEAEVEALRTELHRRKSRLHSLQEIHDKYEGFARGTRAIMQASAELAAPGQEIRGLVADVVTAPERLEMAVEAALGDRLGGILVSSHQVGVKAIQYLKNKSLGRSAFVPYQNGHRTSAGDSSSSVATPADAAGLDAGGRIQVEDRTGSASSRPPFSPFSINGTGVLGRMVDLVSFDPGFSDLGRSLLGDCVVVEGLDRAIELHRQGLAETLVTLEGDIVDKGGVVVGGSREAQGASVLAQKREIRELEEITAKLDSDLADATARFVAAKAELVQVTRAIEGLRKETHQGEIAITVHEKDVARHRGELDRLRERLTQLNAEELELRERLNGVERETTELSELSASATERIERFEREQLGLIQHVTDSQERVEELSHLLTEAKIRAAQLGEKRASIQAATLQLEATERELGERIRKLEATIQGGIERAAVLRGDSTTLQEELVGVRETWRTKAEEFEQGRNAYEHRVAELQATEIAVRELRSRAERLGGEATSMEVKLGNITANRQVLIESIWDRYQLDIAKNLTDYHLRPQITEEDEKKLIELRRLIERMGSDINLTAIEEYAEVSERFEFLNAQKNDLESAVDQLEKAIAKINKTSRQLFKDTFSAVNKQFQELFPRLFRGGRATLLLTNPNPGKNGENAVISEDSKDVDLLEAGVEIVAQPPGKKNSTVDQLSGGEKALTAVALIFSIFLIKPSPFCLLDEVDAPLDEANVGRYNEMVREMTDRSQFIIITHNKRTMEIADDLYGVTMQEPGVSKLVSVNLSKIDQRIAA